MKILSILIMATLAATLGCAEETDTPQAAPMDTVPPFATNAPTSSGSISIQEMLVIGPPQLKMHSLAMMTQGNIKGEIDESYLPGLKVCAEDPALPLRSLVAQLLGQYFVQGRETADPEAVQLLIHLAKDESTDVRYSAVYHGLSQIGNKSDGIIDLLIDIAASDRRQSLYDRIAESLKTDSGKVQEILDRKLQGGNNIAIYEIYEDLTGKKPADADKYLEMPSSRPRLFIVKGEGSDPEADKAELEKTLKAAGIENADVRISGAGENHILLLKTYITKDYLTVERSLSDHPKFEITQDLWLTPEMEIQIEAMQKMKQ